MVEECPDERKTSVIVPIFKGKGNVMSCGSYKRVVVVWQGIYDPGQTQEKDGDRGFILLPPQPAMLPRPDAGSNGVESASCFFIQNCQIHYFSR